MDNRQKATDKIKMSKESLSTAIDLSDLKLQTLPDEIEMLVNLKELNISGNRLTGIPKSICNLRSLVKLDVANNRITELPSSIQYLSQLEDVDLSENRISTLPAEIGRLTNLKKLDIFGNRLTSLPDSICDCVLLAFMDVSCNQLKALPEQIGQLLKLQRLEISGNNLDNLPASFGDLLQLHRLDLRNNRLKSIPDVLTKLPEIEELYLDHNYIQEFPTNLSELLRLRIFSIETNNIPETLQNIDIHKFRCKVEREIELMISGGPEGHKQYFEDPSFFFECFLTVGGVGGVLSVIDLYFKRFKQRCSVDLLYPNGTRVTLSNLSRKKAMQIAQEHETFLANGKAILDMGKAANRHALSVKKEFIVDAVTQIQNIELRRIDDIPRAEEETRTFDVFLSYSGNDKPMVTELAEGLKKRGLDVWFDDWELIPGRPWQEALERIAQTTNSAAILIGSDGVAPWQNREMRACITEVVERGLPVIPVLLPGATAKPELPVFLKQFTWVDLRQGISLNALDRLYWGITGKKPNDNSTGI